jgi:hypothetical protein
LATKCRWASKAASSRPKRLIEGVPEFLELVFRPVEGQAFVQAGRGDPPGRAGDGPDGSQHPAGDEPAGQQGEYGHDGQGDPRVDQKLVRVGRALRGLGGPGLGQLMHGLGQLMHGLCQLMLVLRQLMLVPDQLLVLRRKRTPGQVLPARLWSWVSWYWACISCPGSV